MTGVLDAKGRLQRIGMLVTFVCWIAITVSAAAFQEGTVRAAWAASAIAVLWGGVPCGLSYVIGHALGSALKAAARYLWRLSIRVQK